MVRVLSRALSAPYMKETKLIEICPRCGLVGHLRCDRFYHFDDAVEAYVEARLERERKESR